MIRVIGRFKRFGWPRVDLYGSRTRGDIKILSVEELERLTAVASANPKWSAEGRPEWLRRNRSNIRSLMLTVFGTEGRSVYRCLVMAVLEDKSKCSFTLDLSVGDFDTLPDASLEEVVSLAHRYLSEFPPLALDPVQQETWNRMGGGSGS